LAENTRNRSPGFRRFEKRTVGKQFKRGNDSQDESAEQRLNNRGNGWSAELSMGKLTENGNKAECAVGHFVDGVSAHGEESVKKVAKQSVALQRQRKEKIHDS
jgi:N6-adenosine-specific RNA methylase IME4